MKITCLAENTCQIGNFPTEHGLSLYIETENHHILFDMGQSALFAENANQMGIDLSKVDIAALSHGHYDHGGGLSAFLSLNDKAKIFISPYAFEPHYHGIDKYIGLDETLLGHERMVQAQDIHPICPGVTLYHCNDKKCCTDLADSGLTVREGDIFLPEDFRHEQYLLIEEQGKKVLFSGCSHRGVLNIVSWFLPDIFVGGFHFSNMPIDGTLEKCTKELAQHPTTFYTCHCTGMQQFAFMQQFMPNLTYLSTGDSVEL